MAGIESLYGDSPLSASALTPGQAEYDDGRAAAFAAVHGKKNPPYVRYPLTANTATMAASGLGTAALTGLALTAGTDLSVGKRWAASLGTGVLASIVAMAILRRQRRKYIDSLQGNEAVRAPEKLLAEDQKLPRPGLPAHGYAQELSRLAGLRKSSVYNKQKDDTAHMYDLLNYPAWVASAGTGLPAHLAITLGANARAGNYTGAPKGPKT